MCYLYACVTVHFLDVYIENPKELCRVFVQTFVVKAGQRSINFKLSWVNALTSVNKVPGQQVLVNLNLQRCYGQEQHHRKQQKPVHVDWNRKTTLWPNHFLPLEDHIRITWWYTLDETSTISPGYQNVKMGLVWK